MEMHYSRKQRRAIEKNLGLLDLSGKTKEERAEIVERRKSFGKAAHRNFIQQVENKLNEEDAVREAKTYEGLLELHGKEKADQMVAKWREKEQKKRQKKLQKNNL